MAVSLELQVGAAAGGAQINTVTFAKQAQLTFYLTGFAVTGLGATSAGSADVTFTGAKGATQPTFTVPVVAGVAAPNTPFQQTFGEKGYPGVGQNTDFVVNCASFGAGNTKATLVCWGFYA